MEFENVGFWGDGETWEPKEKPLGARGVGGNQQQACTQQNLHVFHLPPQYQCFHLCTHYAFIYHPIEHCRDVQTQGLMHPWDERNLIVYLIKQNKKLMEKLVTSQRACWGFIET